MTTQPATLQDQLTPLAAQLAAIQSQIKELTDQADSIKARIRDAVPGPDSYAAGELTVTISANRRFDAKQAENVLPTELLDLCRVSRVDSTAAKTVLPPALYEQCMRVVGEPRVSLK